MYIVSLYFAVDKAFIIKLLDTFKQPINFYI